MSTITDINLLDSRVFAERVPFDWFDLLREEAPIHWHPGWAGTEGFWAVTRYADVEFGNRHFQQLSSAQGGITLNDTSPEELELMRKMMLMMDPPEHTKLRKLVNKGFTPRMVGMLRDHIEDLTAEIIDAVIERGECDFVVDLAAQLPLAVICEMMGVPDEDREQVFDWSNRMIGAEDEEYNGNVTEAEGAIDAATEMFFYSTELAARKRQDLGDDIISALLTAEVDGDRLSDEEFNLFFQLLAIAGNETTRNLISHAMIAFFEHPDQWARLVADPTLIDTAVEEMLRWGTPVMYFRRTATEDFVIGGQQVQAGQKVALYYISANRDERVFDDPYRFDITRSPNDHVAFGGGGPHFCLGANLARVEIKAMFEHLVRRMPEIAPAGPAQRLTSNFINGIKHLPVEFPPGPRVSA